MLGLSPVWTLLGLGLQWVMTIFVYCKKKKKKTQVYGKFESPIKLLQLQHLPPKIRSKIMQSQTNNDHKKGSHLK